MTDIEIKIDRRYVIDFTEDLPLPESFTIARALYEADQERKRKIINACLDEYLLNAVSDFAIQKGGE